MAVPASRQPAIVVAALRAGKHVLAQKPFDMGYMAVQFAAADAAGVTSLPKRVETGFAIIDKENISDPEIARFIYQVPGQ